MCATAAVGGAGSAGGSSIGAVAPALARLRRIDSHCARPAARSGGSPRASALRVCAAAGAGPGGGSGAPAERRAPSRLGGPLSETCDTLDWALEGSWRERFRTRAKDACGDTSAECYVRQRQAAKAGVDACVCCDTKCCAWASAHVTWLRGEGSAASLDASEASFRAAVEADPNNAAALAAYAIFVHDERGDKQLASKLFEQAAELAPMDLDVLASWAFFAMLDE